VTVLAWLVCKLALETLTVRAPGVLLVTATPVAERACDAEAATVTAGGMTVTPLADAVCKAAFDTLTSRSGAGVIDTATSVAFRPRDVEARIVISEGRINW